ncbi:HAD family hydrolase [Polaribacter sp. MED152]|uniref:HAD family hydrolase n=1 Tax=Polaribacter sp. MED152 TaxID=313598 RepID=UPI000068C79F|nr:HAD-IA family hydrolase [Polaribacter sp. MED152]EAQ42173.1 haloacid dehalogenase-like hydrolase [Polaribacter sp. MED152]
MIKTILWDFDGVILDSMNVRDWGFEEIFKEYDRLLVDQLLDYHRINGGLSRYVKIRYFFEELLGQSITEEAVLEYANKFSILMKKELTNKKNLIKDSVEFIKNNHKKYNFHVVSGSDQEELRFLNRELGMDQYFISIHGSPTPKKDLVSKLMKRYNYNVEKTCLIGDSINDYQAAKSNKIIFYGYNNNMIKHLGKAYLTSLTNF